MRYILAGAPSTSGPQRASADHAQDARIKQQRDAQRRIVVDSRPMASQRKLSMLMGAIAGHVLAIVAVDVVSSELFVMRVLWFSALTVGGAFIGWLVGGGSNEPHEEEAKSPKEVSPALETDPGGAGEREGGTAEMRFFAVSGKHSSSQLRTMKVRATTAPLSPPSLELRLMIDDYDAAARVTVMEGVLERMTPHEALERTRAEAIARAPKAARTPDLQLVAFRSEGPVVAEGRCPHGWTFYFVDGALGMSCAATTTKDEISLQYQTTSSYHDAGAVAWVDPAVAVEIARADIPAWSTRPLYVRFNLPADILVYQRWPLVVAEIAIDQNRVMNQSALLRTLESERDVGREESFDVQHVVAAITTPSEVPEGDLATALQEPKFAKGLSTNHPGVLRRVAAGLMSAHGPDATAILASAIDELVRADASSVEHARALLHILARTPSGLSAVVLQRLAATSSQPEIKTLADELFTQRRRRQLQVPPDPLDNLDFQTLREAMGKRGMSPIPLISTYNVESDLLEPLAGLGLCVTRARYLSGETRLLLSAYLRARDGETEGLLSSTPLPVPCHVLHVVGPGADRIASEAERLGIAYPIVRILADMRSQIPPKVHIASLYVSALRLDAGPMAPILKALERGRSDVNFKRAVLFALEHASDPDARRYLEEVSEDEELGEVARDVIARVEGRRRGLSAPASRRETISGPLPVTRGPSSGPHAVLERAHEDPES